MMPKCADIPPEQLSHVAKCLPATFTNLVTLEPSTTSSKDMCDFKAGPSMTHYSERIVEDILAEIFAERRGHFPETSSAPDLSLLEHAHRAPEPHVDKRLKYWREMLQKRRMLQHRVQLQTGKNAEQILFNRRSTLDNRNKETVLRLMDYAERIHPEKLLTKPISKLKDLEDPCTCEYIDGIDETWPKAERLGYKNVEVIGLPKVVQQELLGKEGASRELQHSWMKSSVLDERIEQRFGGIRNVIEFFPDLDNLQVTGTNIHNLKPEPKAVLLEEEQLRTISTSNSDFCEEEQLIETWPEQETLEPEPEPEPPEIGLKINNKEYIACDERFSECFEIVVKFTCDPFQRRIRRRILHLTNIGKQTLSFSWKQGIYYYNRATLLLAKDNEFFFDTDSFRLTYGQSYNLIVMYQPRKVSMAVELWRLHVDPIIFCGSQESLQLRFHGRCTPPKDYMARLRELHCVAICKSNLIQMEKLTSHLASLVPLIEPPPACCPYNRDLDEREVFNSLNPGYNCVRFDDLEVLKGMHKHLKKPREPKWDLRLDTIKMFIMRIDGFNQREVMFANYLIVLEPLLGVAPNMEIVSQVDNQKQRTRFIYVRGIICNGIEEWEDLTFTIEESFFKPELQRYYMKLMEVDEEAEQEELEKEEEKKEVKKDEKKEEKKEGKKDEKKEGKKAGKKDDKKKLPSKIELATLDDAEDEAKATADVHRKLRHSKYFRDALYMQTYSHLCNIAEDIVSVIESTEIVPT